MITITGTTAAMYLLTHTTTTEITGTAFTLIIGIPVTINLMVMAFLEVVVWECILTTTAMVTATDTGMVDLGTAVMEAGITLKHRFI